MQKQTILGIDVGASGVKGAIVDLQSGELLTERLRVATPGGTSKAGMLEALRELFGMFHYQGDLVGVGFPSIVKEGVSLTAANIAKEWIGTNVAEEIGRVSGKKVFVVNDADAAGMAEMRHGAGKDIGGTVMLFTIGTGIGSAIFTNGHLVPNTEFGHMELNGMDAEHYAASSARERLNLPMAVWAKRMNEFLLKMEFLFSPNLIILGGGDSKRFEEFRAYLTTAAPVVPARHFNNAGIIGAAIYAAEMAQ